jgi:hypothetical protein
MCIKEFFMTCDKHIEQCTYVVHFSSDFSHFEHITRQTKRRHSKKTGQGLYDFETRSQEV